MDIGAWFTDHHTAISLFGGPIIMALVWKIPKLHWSLKIVLVFLALFLAVGVWGIMLNWWVVPVLLLWYAAHKGVGLKPIRWLTLGLAVILLAAAVAFLLYVFYQHPDEIIKNIVNPLIILYFIPGGLLMIFSNMVQEKIDARNAKEIASVQ